MSNTALVITNTFGGNTSGSTGQLDVNFAEFIAALNTLTTYSNYFLDQSAVPGQINVTVPPGLNVSLSPGLQLQIKVANTIPVTGGASLLINALPNTPIINPDGSNIGAAQIVIGSVITVIYEAVSGVFQLIAGGNDNAAFTPIVPPANGWYLSAPPVMSLNLGGAKVAQVTNVGEWTLTGSGTGALFELNVGPGEIGLYVLGGDSVYGAEIFGSPNAGKSFGQIITAGTNSADVAFAVQNRGSTNVMLQIQGDSSIGMGGVGASFALRIPAGGGMVTYTGADLTARGVPFVRFSAAGETRTNTTILPSATLQAIIPAAGNYAFKVVATFDASGGGVAVGMAFSSSFTALGSFAIFQGNNNSIAFAVTAEIQNALTAQHSVVATGSFIGYVIEGHLTATNGGTLSFGFGQQTTNAVGTNMHPGAYIAVTPLN